ncbi:MAG: DUF2461 domain-containing protein [Bacteroidetes bacterium]|jgi:uncharacterized protein (TIGR02453 family)|nr:DUF2461 domain-containing protein [Bacteroidota bacterium]
MEVEYFTKDYLEFFKELAANNHKNWFDENRKRYEKSVKQPFKQFVERLIAEVELLDPEQKGIEAKDCIFRINRDIRFSKDKTPYKLNNSAIVSPGGKKGKDVPGVYIELGPEKVRLFGGVHGLDKQNLEDFRYYLAANSTAFEKLIHQKDFLTTYGEILGAKAKRIPKDLKEAAEKQPLIYNKQWYFTTEYVPEVIFEPTFIKTLMGDVQKGFEVTKFIRKGIHY